MMIPFPVIKEKGKKTGKAFALVLSLSLVFVCFAFPFFLSYFFVKKIPLSWRVWGMLLWINGSVRDVYMSHQSDWSYYKQPIKLLHVKVNHVCGDFILILEGPSLFFYKQKQVL